MLKRNYSLVSMYVGREYLFSFFVAFLFFFFIFFINQMLLLAEDVLAKHVPVFDVMLLILYSLPAVVAISFPFASLVGALMAVGRLSSDNETVAFQASGVPLRRIFIPILFLGVILSVFSFIMNDYFLPLGTLNFGKLYRRLLASNPELELESYSVKHFQDSVIVTGKVDGKKIDNIVIIDRTPETGKRIISAKTATLVENSEEKGAVISLKLENVFSQNVPDKKTKEFEYTTSKEMIYNILLSDITVSISNPTAREMSSVDVYKIIRKKQEDLDRRRKEQQARVRRLELSLSNEYFSSVETLSSNGRSIDREVPQLEKVRIQLDAEKKKKLSDRSLQITRLEFHKKFSIPFACFFFVVFAFPVGLFTRRSGRSVGFGIGLFVSIFYWGMLIGGQTMGSRTMFSPVLSMWLPNFVVLCLGLVFLIIRVRK